MNYEVTHTGSKELKYSSAVDIDRMMRLIRQEVCKMITQPAGTIRLDFDRGTVYIEGLVRSSKRKRISG